MIQQADARAIWDVASRGDAWIEILVPVNRVTSTIVASRGDAWIEMPAIKPSIRSSKVASRGDAWIEIVRILGPYERWRSHPVRMRGLK